MEFAPGSMHRSKKIECPTRKPDDNGTGKENGQLREGILKGLIRTCESGFARMEEGKHRADWRREFEG